MSIISWRYQQTDIPIVILFHFRKNPGAKRFDDDWEIPVISEETLDKLTTMFTIYPEYVTAIDSYFSRPSRIKFNSFLKVVLIFIDGRYFFNRIENNVSVVAMDSHPKRTNGFLTGCLQSVLNNNVYARPFIEELPR